VAFWLRLGGWIGFLGGGAFFLFTGATLTDRENLLPWVGLFGMLFGMILTSLSNLANHIARMRRLKQGKPPDPAE
jgi:hypothetical protein